MRVIIAGSRGVTDLQIVWNAMQAFGNRPSEVVSGTARGVDQLGEKWALGNNVPVKRFPADWNGFGRGAGYIRNKQMADYADALVAIWDGESRGTKHMIDTMKAAGKPVYIYKP